MSKNYTIVATCFDKRGRIISQRVNGGKTHPLQAKYAALAGQPKRVLLHAEIAALLAAGTRPVHRIHVTRYDSYGNPKMAKPCAICQRAIDDWSVKEVTYTVG